MSITPHTKTTATVGAFCSIVITMFVFGWRTSAALGEKADQSTVNTISVVVGEKADKKEVENLREYFYELSAKRREDSVKLESIYNKIQDVNTKISDIQKDQKWQIEQEVKRLQWQSFKQEPAPTPTPNAHR